MPVLDGFETCYQIKKQFDDQIIQANQGLKLKDYVPYVIAVSPVIS